MKLIKDLGMLYATKKSKQKTRFGIYICSKCNKQVKASTYSVNSGKAKQCYECRKSIYKGEAQTRLGYIYRSILRRCYTKSLDNKYYKDIGVTMCDEWKNDFFKFKEWSLNNGYDENKVIDKDIMCDRLNISPKIYSPNTCLWITQDENIKYSCCKKIHKFDINNNLIGKYNSLTEVSSIENKALSTMSKYVNKNIIINNEYYYKYSKYLEG